MRTTLLFALALLAIGCDDPATERAAAPVQRGPTPRRAPEPEPGAAPSPPPTPTIDDPAPPPAADAPRVARLDAPFVFPDGCWSARASDAESALARCRELDARGDRWQRRACVCERARLIEVRPGDPVHAYMGCCWGVGATPEEAATACAAHLREGWCELDEAGDARLVHPITGPYDRRAPGDDFDDPATHRYLTHEGHWVTAEGEPPCFPSGTLVELERGARAIEDVRPGDRVLAYDPARTSFTLAPVLRVKHRTSTVLLTLRTTEGRAIRATPEHPFWLAAESDWREAGALALGDRLLVLDAPRATATVEVGSIAPENVAVPVHTLTVAAPHTFFADGFLVHNY